MIVRNTLNDSAPPLLVLLFHSSSSSSSVDASSPFSPCLLSLSSKSPHIRHPTHPCPTSQQLPQPSCIWSRLPYTNVAAAEGLTVTKRRSTGSQQACQRLCHPGLSAKICWEHSRCSWDLLPWHESQLIVLFAVPRPAPSLFSGIFCLAAFRLFGWFLSKKWKVKNDSTLSNSSPSTLGIVSPHGLGLFEVQ